MPVLLDHELREKIPHKSSDFPITYYHDELESLPNFEGPYHWHPDFEIATAIYGDLDFQIGQHHVILKAGDSIFVNCNVLHAIRQISGTIPDPMPNVVFSSSLIASQTSAIYQKYIHFIAQCDTLPFVVFRHNNKEHQVVNECIKDIYQQFEDKKFCYEMRILRDVSYILEYICSNFDIFPKAETTRMQIKSQIRFQKMLSYIYTNYDKNITLADIANSANISKSEAGRCFHTFMGCSPIDALIQYRLQYAHKMLDENIYSMQEISNMCGFNSVNYFSRKFKSFYGYSPSNSFNMGK